VLGDRINVSIHAPVKSATMSAYCDPAKVEVSIHAPVKSATRVGMRSILTLTVSIHAPVKSATFRAFDGLLADLGKFQSTRP